MQVQQISVFVENKSGRLAEVTDLLAKHAINLRALALADTADFGILRLIVNNLDKATGILKENGFTISKNEVVAVVIPDQPGGLANILNILQAKGINVEYLYAFAQRLDNNAVLVFRFDDINAAIDTLQKAGIRMLSDEEARKM